jgi:hypothetical protein
VAQRIHSSNERWAWHLFLCNEHMHARIMSPILTSRPTASTMEELFP